MRINPLKAQRLKLGLTQDQLASASGVTRQVVTLAEQGLYIQPPVSLLEALRELGAKVDLVRLDWSTWVIEKRWDNAPKFYKVELRGAKNPWATLKHQVSGTSMSGFCKALVYQGSLVREFEKFGTGASGIYRALAHCGLSGEQIEELL